MICAWAETVVSTHPHSSTTMKRGAFNFLGRKNQSLFDTNIKMTDMGESTDRRASADL